MSLTTFLSKYVYRIIVEYGHNFDSHIDNYLCRNLTYDWEKIGEEFGPLADELDVLGQEESWYLEKACVVWSAVHSAAVAVSSATSDERRTLYELSAWVTAEYLGPRESRDDCDTLLAVLLLTSAFERALGNVYSSKSLPVPFLLRDLLKTDELSSVFGKVPILFSQLLLGCPKGLNLRNVVWHGFASPGELHPHLVTGLIVLFASLGQALPKNQVIPKRPQFSSFESFSSDLKEMFPDVWSDKEGFETIVDTSPHISKRNCVYWRKCYELFKNGRFGYSLVLLLPLVEHCLREIYCKVHDCPTRLLTAESTTLYTTMDEILAPSDCPVLGEGLLMSLLDITSSLSGPRLRDKLSHGECDLSTIPRWLVNHVFAVALSVAHYQDSHEDCSVGLCRSLRSACSQYRSRYHIMTSLRRHIDTMLSHWVEWQLCLLPPILDLELATCPHIYSLDQLLFAGIVDVTGKVAAVQDRLNNSDPSTLYRTRPELELATCLFSVVRNVDETVVKMRVTARTRSEQWKERTLRSRARDTCLRMWSTLPDLSTTLLSLLMFTTLCYRNLSALTHVTTSLRLVKCTLKAVENTVTLCEADKNRWTEAHRILSTLAKSIHAWLEENKSVLLT